MPSEIIPTLSEKKVPSRISHTSSEKVDDEGCYSVTFTSDDNILVGSMKGVTSLRKPRGRLYEKFTRVEDIVEYKHSRYLVHRLKTKMIVYQVLPDLSSGTELFTVDASNKTPQFSVNDSLLVITDNRNNKLIVYDFGCPTERRTVTIPGLKSHDDAVFTSETSLLVTSEVDNRLVHYDLAKREVIWTCEQVKNASCVTRDASTGLIYVVTNGTKTIYVISEQGKGELDVELLCTTRVKGNPYVDFSSRNGCLFTKRGRADLSTCQAENT